MASPFFDGLFRVKLPACTLQWPTITLCSETGAPDMIYESHSGSLFYLLT